MNTRLTAARDGMQSPTVEEQRSSPRQGYFYRQAIAPITEDGMPIFDEMSGVDCRDISGGGMSFYAESEPNYKRLLVSLGLSPNSHYFLAKVVRSSRDAEGEDERYIVGCEFIKRIYL